MNRNMKLLALGFAVLIVLLSAETYALQLVGNQSQASPVRVACVGDSLTCGTGYPVDLWQMIGSRYVIGNFGVNGATVFHGSDNPYLNTTALQVAMHFEPQIVIILLGTNDANTNLNESNSAFVNDYVKLVDLFQGLASKPKVWVVEPPPIFNSTSGLSPDYLVQNIIPDIQQVANQTGASVIDLYNPLVNHSAYFPVDGVHPDSDGAEAIAILMYNAVFSNDNHDSSATPFD